jgi:hypothetical protein
LDEPLSGSLHAIKPSGVVAADNEMYGKCDGLPTSPHSSLSSVLTLLTYSSQWDRFSVIAQNDRSRHRKEEKMSDSYHECRRFAIVDRGAGKRCRAYSAAVPSFLPKRNPARGNSGRNEVSHTFIRCSEPCRSLMCPISDAHTHVACESKVDTVGTCGVTSSTPSW